MPDFAAVGAAELSLRLDAIERAVHEVTHNTFTVNAASFVAACDGERMQGFSSNIAPGDTVLVTESELNNGLYVAESSGYAGTTLDRPLLPAGRNRVTLVRYPADVRLGVLGMLRWDIKNRSGKAGVQSETLSRHSVTYRAGSEYGYPSELTAFLKPYRKMRTC
jgi:hypothetical protein